MLKNYQARDSALESPYIMAIISRISKYIAKVCIRTPICATTEPIRESDSVLKNVLFWFATLDICSTDTSSKFDTDLDVSVRNTDGDSAF